MYDCKESVSVRQRRKPHLGREAVLLELPIRGRKSSRCCTRKDDNNSVSNRSYIEKQVLRLGGLYEAWIIKEPGDVVGNDAATRDRPSELTTNPAVD